jgi:hypothetical protein
VSVPLLAGVLFAVGLVLIGVFMVVRQINVQSVRCTPQHACVDAIDQPYVMRRGS